MNVLARPLPNTVEQFLAWEDQQEGKFEFNGEDVEEMTGGSANHQSIVFNLLKALKARLDRSRFIVLQEMRLRVGNKVRYPDAVVVPAPVPGSTRTLSDAVVAFEVLSPDTEHKDREMKRAECFSLPSLTLYILIDQLRRKIWLSRKEGGTAVEHELAEGSLALPGLPDRSGADTGIDIDLIYEDVDFAP